MSAKIAVIETGSRKPIFNLFSKDTKLLIIKSTPQKIEKDLSNGLELIILDVAMPNIDSSKILEKIKTAATAGISPIPLIKYVCEKNLRAKDIEKTVQRIVQNVNIKTSQAPEYQQGKWRSVSISEIAEGMGVSRAILAQILGTTERNLGRWIKGETVPSGKRDLSLQKMKYIYYLLGRAFKKIAIPKYLRESNPTLRGRTPLMILQAGDFDSLEADLQQLIEGVYI